MKKISIKTLSMAALIISLGTGTSAFATEGYFMNGVGAASKAVAGADIANAHNALASANNPAGILGAGDVLEVGVSLFSPKRGFTGRTAPNMGAFTPNGEVTSGQDYFPVPAFGYVKQLDANSAISLAAFGNGGMNTTYGDVFPRNVGFPCSGVFCMGKSGVSLNQLYVTGTYARRLNENISIGISPTYVLQAFKASGLGAFAGVSSSPANMTNRNYDWSSGFGVRLGAEIALSENFRIGASFQPKINMSEFDAYAGLFADKGDFDIPANYSLGIAMDASDKLTLMLGYRHIAYSDVNSVGNSGQTPLPFGAANGPGFGWDDVDTVKLGMEYKTSDEWTWRAGISNNNNPIGPEDVTLNILAPGVVELHLTGGFAHDMGNGNAIEAAFMYAPESKVRGIEVTPQGANPAQTIELNMHQFEATISWAHKFGN